MPHLAHELVEQGRNCRLAVRTRYADQGQLFARFTEPLACQQTQRLIRVIYENKSSPLYIVLCTLYICHVLAFREYNGTCTFGDTTINECMSIYCCAYLGYKQVAFANLAAVEMDTLNLLVR